jgi:hypothetical protein
MEISRLWVLPVITHLFESGFPAKQLPLIDPVNTTFNGAYPFERDSITTPKMDERVGLLSPIDIPPGGSGPGLRKIVPKG